MRLYLKYMKILLKSQMIYSKSFILLCIGQFFVPFYVFLGVLILFDQFGNLMGWTLQEVAMIYGVIHLSYSMSETLVRGFDTFSGQIIRGEFDRVLVRPQSTVLQVLGSKLELTHIGRLIQGLVILIWAIVNIDIKWTVLKGITVLFMITGGTAIMAGLFVMFASMCFWTVQGLEIANIFTDGGREMAQYPLSIYKKWVRRFFTFVIPFGLVNYIPMNYILGTDGYTSVGWVFVPLAGVLFLIPSLALWHFGVSRYQSTGS